MNADWARIKAKEIDAIMFIHEDYINFFLIIDNTKTQFIIETWRHAFELIDEYRLRTIDIVLADEIKRGLGLEVVE